MVAHNKNYQPAAPVKPARNPRTAAPVDKVNPLHETDLICELADPRTSLEELCAAHEISLEALSLWMARPDVAERLDLMQTTAMNRARFIGRLTLPVAAQSAANIINAHKLRPQKPTIDAAFGSDLHRANETMLKAARFLQRLTTEAAPKSLRRHSEAPSHFEDSQEGVGEGSERNGNTISRTQDGAEVENSSQTSADLNNADTTGISSHAPCSIEEASPNTRPTPRKSRGSKNRSLRNPRARARKSRTVPGAPTSSRINQSRVLMAPVPASAALRKSLSPHHPDRAADPASPIPRVDASPPRTRGPAHSPSLRSSSD